MAAGEDGKVDQTKSKHANEGINDVHSERGRENTNGGVQRRKRRRETGYEVERE